MENNKPIFIRRNGRIIPIFSKKQKRQAIEGTQSIGTGVAMMTAGGLLSGHIKKRSNNLKTYSSIASQNAKAVMSPALQKFGFSTGKGQLDLFLNDEIRTKTRTHRPALKASMSARVESMRKLLTGQKFNNASLRVIRIARLSSAASIGLGIEKLVAASGIDQDNTYTEHLSETAGVASAYIADKGTGALVKKYGDNIGFRTQLKSAGKSVKYKDALLKVGKLLLKRKGF